MNGWGTVIASATLILGVLTSVIVGATKLGSAETKIDHLEKATSAQGTLMAQVVQTNSEHGAELDVLNERFDNVEEDVDEIKRTIKEDRAASREDRREFIDAVDRLTKQLEAENTRR